MNLVGLIDDPTDFSSPCKSLISSKAPVYLDISDDDEFIIPCSQKKLKTFHDGEM